MRRAIADEEDLKDIAENWEPLDVRVKSERRVKVENVVPKVPSDPKENPDPSDRWVKKETTDLRACLDWRDLQDLKELKDRLDLRETLDLPDLLDLPVHRENCLFYPLSCCSNETAQRLHPGERSAKVPTVKKSTKIATSAQLVASRTTDPKRI